MCSGLLVLEITGSAFWVGAVFGVNGAALTICSFIGGLLADRFYRRRYTLVAIGILIEKMKNRQQMIIDINIRYHMMKNMIVNILLGIYQRED